MQILQNTDRSLHKLLIETWIKRLVKGGPVESTYATFNDELKKFQTKLQHLDKIVHKIVVRLAVLMLIISFFCSFTDLSSKENVFESLGPAIEKTITLWLACVTFYIGRSLTDVYGSKKYFFSVKEKINLKKFFSEKNRMASRMLENPYVWFNM
jgi:hypothetical protein